VKITNLASISLQFEGPVGEIFRDNSKPLEISRVLRLHCRRTQACHRANAGLKTIFLKVRAALTQFVFNDIQEECQLLRRIIVVRRCAQGPGHALLIEVDHSKTAVARHNIHFMKTEYVQEGCGNLKKASGKCKL
jgi:hypothetical protein